MNVHTFYPENTLLKKHVAYYYFLKTNSADFYSSYYVFPNIQQAFNIHKSVSCDISPHTISVQADLKNRYLMIAQGKHEIPLFVQLKGILDKVTVIFKPLGFNHFIQSPLIAVAPKPRKYLPSGIRMKIVRNFYILFIVPMIIVNE